MYYSSIIIKIIIGIYEVGILMIKKLYKFGEYFSPLDVVKIAIKKN